MKARYTQPANSQVVLVFLHLLRGEKIQIAHKVLLSVAVVSMAAAGSSLIRLKM